MSGPLGAAAAERGSGEFLAMWAGQAAALVRELPAAQLVARIVSDAQRLLAALARCRPPLAMRPPHRFVPISRRRLNEVVEGTTIALPSDPEGHAVGLLKAVQQAAACGRRADM